MSPYFSRLAQRSRAAPSRSALGASADAAGDWGEQNDLIANAPIAPTNPAPEQLPTIAPSVGIASPGIVSPRDRSAAMESATAIPSPIAGSPPVPTVSQAPGAIASPAETTLILETKFGDAPRPGAENVVGSASIRQPRYSTISDAHPAATARSLPASPMSIAGDGLIDIGEQATSASPSVATTPPRSARVDAASHSSSIDTESMAATSRDAVSPTRAPRSAARASSASSAAQPRPAPTASGTTSRKSSATIDVHIGRVDVEVTAPPARQTVSQRPAPTTAAPTRRPAATNFNPHRHYLRSR